MSSIKLSTWLLLLLLSSPISLVADCKSIYKDVPIAQTSCSGGLWANLSNSDGSLAKESPKLLSKAEAEIITAKPPENYCPANCIASQQPAIVSYVIPEFYVSHEDYPEAELCKRLQIETSHNPIEFNEKHFSSLEDFSEWFTQFSRGDGEDGGILYERCPGDCSIRYETVVRRVNNSIKAKSIVRCGIARDKELNSYKVSLAYRWGCDNPKT